MHNSAVNLDLHGNRFTPLDLENQGAAVGQVLVGRVKSDGLPVKPHDWWGLACRSWMQAVNDHERWPRAPGLDREVRRARLVANRLHRAGGVNPHAAGAKSVKLVR